MLLCLFCYGCLLNCFGVYWFGYFVVVVVYIVTVVLLVWLFVFVLVAVGFCFGLLVCGVD